MGEGPAGAPTTPTGAKGGVPPSKPAAAWLEDAASALGRANNDGDLIRWLVQFSTEFVARPAAVEGALEILDAHKGTERFRAILVLLIGVASDSAGKQQFERLALSSEAVVAGASARGILLRSSRIRPCPPLAPWFKTFWLNAFVDQYVGALLNPGFADRQPEAAAPAYLNERTAAFAWLPPDAARVRNWRGGPLRPDDEEDRSVLERIAVEGQSPAAKMPALRELPVDARTDRVVRRVLQDDKGSYMLRAFCYEQLAPQPINWPIFAEGLRTETNPRVLCSVVVLSLSAAPGDSRIELVTLLEQVADRVPLAEEGDLAERLTDALSATETTQGLDALVRMARLAKDDALRTTAACAIATCSFGSTFTQERISALVGLFRDPDPVVAASGACGLLAAASSNALRDAARPAMQPPALERIRALASDPHVPEYLRQTLGAQLGSSQEQPPK